MEQKYKTIGISVIIIIAIIIAFLFLYIPSTIKTPDISQPSTAPETQTNSQVSSNSAAGSREYIITSLPERIELSELIFIGTFTESSEKFGGSNKYPKFTDLEILKGDFNNSQITVMGPGGADTLYFKRGSKYLLFSKDYNQDGIYDLFSILTAEYNEIKTDDLGNEITGCIADEVECIKKEIPCPDTNTTFTPPEPPIVRDSEGNIIPQPSQPERKCYSQGYSFLKDLLVQIKNQD